MFVWLGIICLTFVLADNPPKHTQANPVNKQEVHKVEVPIAETPVAQASVTPQIAQPVEEPIAVQPEPVSYPIGCEQYVAEVSKYNWNVGVMVNIMKAESGCSTYAVGDNYQINGLHAPSCGLLQIRSLAGRPSCEELKNPITNISWAWRIYQSQGYPAWSVCRTKVSCY